jgi:AraC-like DNA-binding protein
VEPDLELVQVRYDQSFKIWSHGYPFRTVRWHFHPEYELHLVTTTTGNRFVGNHIGPFAPGDLVFMGPNLPHNWISDVPPGETIDERCLVLQFTGEFITACMATFPELRFLQRLLEDSRRGLRFSASTSAKVEPLMRELLAAEGARRITLLIAILDTVAHDAHPALLAGPGFQPDPTAYLSKTMNVVLQYIGRNLTGGLNETALAKLSRQSVSTFSRSFRRHTGMSFVHYVNSLRIELACQHLGQDDLTIADICYAVGFNNVSNFNRQFRAAKGMAPSNFRALRKGSLAQAA